MFTLGEITNFGIIEQYGGSVAHANETHLHVVFPNGLLAAKYVEAGPGDFPRRVRVHNSPPTFADTTKVFIDIRP